MKAFAIIVLILLPPVVVQADCGRLTANDDYEKLNEILECLDSRITELQERVTPGASPGSGKAISEGKPVSRKEGEISSQVTESEEIEPNDNVSQATRIALGTTIRGRLKREDKDYYQFKVPEGFDHKVRIIYRPLSYHLGKVVGVQVFDSVEKVVAMGNDANGSDPVSLAISAEANSTYFIKVGWQVFSGDKLDYELVIRKEQE
jgi:hypothetical protein